MGIEASLDLEKKVHEALLDLHKVADSHGDAQLTDFIEGEYLKEQVEAQKEIGDLITKMIGLEMLLVSTSLTKSSNNKSKAQITPPSMSLCHCLHQSSFIINFMWSISSASLVKL